LDAFRDVKRVNIFEAASDKQLGGNAGVAGGEARVQVADSDGRRSAPQMGEMRT